MRSRSTSLNALKLSFIALLLIGAGIATFSLRPNQTDHKLAAQSPQAANASDSNAVGQSTSSIAKAAPTSGAKPSLPPANQTPIAAASSSQSPSPSLIPPVTTPHEPEPEIDLSTHYVLINGQRAHPYKLIAKYKSPEPSNPKNQLLAQNDLRTQTTFDLTPAIVVLRPNNPILTPVTSPQDAEARGKILLSRIRELSLSGQFEYVEPDYIVTADATPTDTAFTDGSLWGLRNTGQNGGLSGADIDAVRAWDTTTGSTSVVVAVIDTGIRYTHQDLAAQMWQNPDEIAGNGLDDDQDGYIDNIYGINGITNSGNPLDDQGHGTHCAGTIGAQANGGGGHVGVAWSVKLMACKFLSSSGGGTTSDAIKCINFAVLKGAHILSNSWGGGGSSQALSDAITAANASGVLFVAAAGNSSLNTDVSPAYPASYPQANIISVAALDRNDRLASFSNFGASSVDIGAPGVSIYSTYNSSDTGYSTLSGTSMACPHVAGVAALVLADQPNISLSELRQRILSGAVPIDALAGKCFTGGRLNAYNALNGEPDGTLEVSVVPGNGAELAGGITVSMLVYVRDFDAVNNATVSGTVGGTTNLTFRNDGVAPDITSGDNIYTSTLTTPTSGATLAAQVQVSAPGKTASTTDLTFTLRHPPTNDAFAARTTLIGNASTVTGTNIGASREVGEPAHYNFITGKSVWWSWTAAVNGTVTFKTVGSTFDTVLAIYTGTALNALTLVRSDDDSGGNLTSLISTAVTAGTTYQIAVDGYGSASGSITLITSFETAPVAPANDNFASAAALTGTIASATGDNRLATRETGEPLHAGNTGGKSVWWTWTAPTAGTVTLSTDGSDFDTTLGVYVGTAVNSLATIAGDNDSGEGTRSLVSFTATAGTTYRIAVDGFNGTSSGSIALALSLVVTPPIPINDAFSSRSIITLSANVATLTGTNIGSSKETGEPDHAGNSGGRSVWWTWTAPSSGTLTLTTGGSNFDTLLAVYTGSAVNALTLVTSNDEDPSGGVNTSRVQFNVTIGTVYQIAVDGQNTGLNLAIGNITLNATYSTIVIPANDNFAMRTVVPGATATLTGSNVAATAEIGEPAHHSPAARSLWWSWTAPSTTSIMINTFGSSFDTVLAVYTGTALNSLTRIASNDDTNGNNSQVIINATAGTTYQIAVDGYYGSTGNITLNVNPPILAPTIVNQPSPSTQSFYVGENFYLSVYATSPVPMTYQWKKGGVSLTNSTRISGATNSSMSITGLLATDAGVYTVDVTNSTGTTTSTTVTLTVVTPGAPVIVAQPQTQGVYLGENLSLYVGTTATGPQTYQWQKSIDGGVTFTNLSNATASSYYINNFQLTHVAQYRVIITNAGGTTTSNAATITSIVPTAPTFSSNPSNITVVGGNSFSVYAYASGRGLIAYRWQKDGVDLSTSDTRFSGVTSYYLSVYNARMSDSGQYRLVATNAGGSVTSTAATVTVTVPPLPSIYSQPTSRTITAGNSTSFSVGVLGAINSYQWQKDGVNLVDGPRISGATTSFLTLSYIQVADAGQYRLIITNDGGSVTSNAATLTVNLPAPPTFVGHPGSMSLIQGASFTLSSSVNSSSVVIYQWYKDNVLIAGANSSFYSKTNSALTDAGRYKLAATNAGGTTFSNEAVVTINPATAPIFVVHPESTATEVGDSLTLSASATANPTATYRWFKNGAFISGATAPTLTFTTTAGDHDSTYYAEASNSAGIVHSNTATLTVFAVGSGKVLGLAPATRLVGAGRVVYPLTLRSKSTWTVTKSANWITLLETTGRNSRTLEITVAPNPFATERTATITIGDLTHTLTQRAAGTPIRELWTTGENLYGQLGDGSLPLNPYPALMEPSGVAVTAGRDHSFFIKPDRTAWAIGENALGQLGDGTRTNRRFPAQVLTGVQIIATGYYHTLFLKTDGTLWVAGEGSNGQLGTGSTADSLIPVQIATGVRSIAAGSLHSAFVKTDGTLWATGYNSDGQLGTGNTATLSTPVQIATGVSAVAAGGWHTIYLKTDGTVWTVGYNGPGQLGTGNNTSRSTAGQIDTGAKAIFAGALSTFVIKTDDSLRACGYNFYGQLGIGSTSSRTTLAPVMSNVAAVASGYYHTLILKTDATLWACGQNVFYQLGDGTDFTRTFPVPIASNVTSAAVGEDHSLFTKADQTVWAMGSNATDQIGSASPAVTGRFTPINIASEVSSAAVGSYHTLFLTTNGSAWSVGGNSDGQLGDGGSGFKRSVPFRIAGEVASVKAGWYASMLVKTDGSLHVAGYNSFGELGDANFSRRFSFTRGISSVAEVSMGTTHTLIRKSDGSLQVTGSNYSGQLGLGSSMSATTSPLTLQPSLIAQIAAAGNHTLFLKTDNSLWVTGANDYGQLGDGTGGTVLSRYTPVQVSGSYTGVSGGLYHSLMLKTDGTVWATGRNNYGQLGDATFTTRLAPAQVITDVRSLSAGGNQSLFIKTDNSLWAAGDNSAGQLAYSTSTLLSTPRKVAANVQSASTFDSHTAFIATGDIRVTPPAAPTITTVSPSRPTAGATVTITGTNFANLADVYFNNTPATNLTVVSTTQLTVRSPADYTSDLTVVVAGFDGHASTSVAAPTPTPTPPASGGGGGGGGSPSVVYLSTLALLVALRARRQRV